MGIEIEVNLTRKIKVVDFLDQMASTLNDRQLIECVKYLNEKAESWDFTLDAAKVLITDGLKLTTQDGTQPAEWTLIRQAAEFLRQAKLAPSVDRTGEIMGVWTDPNAQQTILTVDMLETLIELAMVGLGQTEGQP